MSEDLEEALDALWGMMLQFGTRSSKPFMWWMNRAKWKDIDDDMLFEEGLVSADEDMIRVLVKHGWAREIDGLIYLLPNPLWARRMADADASTARPTEQDPPAAL